MHHSIKMNNGNQIHRIWAMSNQQLNIDILNNKKYGFTAMAYPFGAFNEQIKQILVSQGYLVAFKFGHSAYATRKDDRFAIPRIKVIYKKT